MVPRTDAFMIDINDTVEENVNKVLSENYSRILSITKTKIKVVGILHTKNLLKAAHKFGFDHLDIKKSCRSLYSFLKRSLLMIYYMK